ncbi:MAG: VTT domain-containing protein [bacterium]
MDILIYGVILMMFLGDILSDITWYSIGYYGGNAVSKKIGQLFNINNKIEKVKGYLEERGGKIIIWIKFTTGFCLAMLITAGTVRMKFKKFLHMTLSEVYYGLSLLVV